MNNGYTGIHPTFKQGLLFKAKLMNFLSKVLLIITLFGEMDINNTAIDAC